FNYRGLANNKTCGVIEKNSASNLRCGIDVALENGRRPALQVERKILPSLAVQPVRETMSLDGVEALVIEHGFYESAGGRIAIHSGNDVGPERVPQRRLIL